MTTNSNRDTGPVITHGTAGRAGGVIFSLAPPALKSVPPDTGHDWSAGPWKHPANSRRSPPFLVRFSVAILFITLCFILAGVVIAAADKALSQAAYDAVFYGGQE